ncbi:nuclear transport factor 2 family protein [Mycobacterium sp. SMC-4]|uniref:nuclear transport factor 2 family protein n=1 Tax=Mycobacterium sp. SMC-4 TaxID=2857059 RepID=UPI0021B21B04|nr:nuclear transport factor 2 family protein [Mycobacterium sp. SMC-4]UXA19066.1 nuclear transport factor 2 family protein [Mycobacterium sp. SMC-4]
MTTTRPTSRNVRNLVTLLSAAVVAAGCAGATSQAAPPAGDGQRNAQIVRDGLARGVGGPDTFYALLAEDVQWTVARAATPRTYTSRQEFLDVAAGPIVDRLTGPIRAEVHEIIADQDRVVARWRGTATARDGQPYVNEYNWVMALADDQITRVVAYLDFVELDALIARVPLAS